MESTNFIQSTADPCILLDGEENDLAIIVPVYVDDLIINIKSLETMKEIKDNLATRFQMKDLENYIITWDQC